MTSIVDDRDFTARGPDRRGRDSDVMKSIPMILGVVSMIVAITLAYAKLDTRLTLLEERYQITTERLTTIQSQLSTLNDLFRLTRDNSEKLDQLSHQVTGVDPKRRR